MDRTRTSIPLAAVPRPGRDSGDSRGCVYAPAPTTTRSLAPRALAPARRAEWRTPSGTSRRRNPCCPPSLRRWLLLRWSRQDVGRSCRMMREAGPDGKTLITLDQDFVYTVHPEGDPIACETNAARANETNARDRERPPRAGHGHLRSSGRRGDRIGRRHRTVGG